MYKDIHCIKIHLFGNDKPHVMAMLQQVHNQDLFVELLATKLGRLDNEVEI